MGARELSIAKRQKMAVSLKGCLSVAVAIISLCVILFMPYIKYEDNSLDIVVSISLVRYLMTMGQGSYSAYIESLGTTITLGYNGAFSGLTVYVLIAQIIAVVAPAICYFAFKKDIPYIGYYLYFSALVLLFEYFFFLTSYGVRVINIYGEDVPFFKEFRFGVSILLVALFDIIEGVICLHVREGNVERVRKYLPLYGLLIIPGALIVTFSIYPIILQTILSFKNYKISDGIFGSDWIGMGNFQQMFTDPSLLKMIGNTIFISVCRMALGIIPPLILALLLFDIGLPRYRKVLQTIIYIPHFFSWVIIFAIAYAFVNQEGIINNIIVACGGQRYAFFNNDSAFYHLIFITDVWKELGWGTILFFAALSGVDPTLYEAASLDGAGAMRKLFKITIPSIAPTIVFVSIMAIGNLLKGAGGEQLLLFGSENMESAQTIDTWVVWKGLGGGEYGLSSAVSFFQSAVGLVLVVMTNRVSKRYTGMGIW